MKTTSTQNKSTAPSPFQITVLPENFALPSVSEAALQSSRTPFTDLMLHPEKLEAALKIARSENDAFNEARTFAPEHHHINKPPPQKIMKTKILFLAMLAFAAMALAGCGNNSQTTANPPSDQQMPSPGASDNSAVTTNLDNTNTPASTNQ